jgi:hypothetical protein
MLPLSFRAKPPAEVGGTYICGHCFTVTWWNVNRPNANRLNANRLNANFLNANRPNANWPNVNWLG